SASATKPYPINPITIPSAIGTDAPCETAAVMPYAIPAAISNIPIHATTRATAKANPRWRVCRFRYGSQRRGSISGFLVVRFGAAVVRSQATEGHSDARDPETVLNTGSSKAAIRNDHKLKCIVVGDGIEKHPIAADGFAAPDRIVGEQQHMPLAVARV